MSTTFLNGPAASRHLELARSPRFLRAVRSAAGDWDALDQPADEPRPGEQVFVYRRLGEPLMGVIDWHDGRGRRGNRFSCARYAVVDPQPPEQVLRDTAAWQVWCRAAAAAADAEPAGIRAAADAALVAAAEAADSFGLPDVQQPGGRRGGGRRTPPPAADGQGLLFGGQG